MLNTLIPLRLGELVNTVAHLQPGLSLNAYTTLLMPTALSLVILYVTQVSAIYPHNAKQVIPLTLLAPFPLCPPRPLPWKSCVLEDVFWEIFACILSPFDLSSLTSMFM